MELDHYIAVLITQALDDIEEHRLSVEEALRFVADAAWTAGRNADSDRIGDDPKAPGSAPCPPLG